MKVKNKITETSDSARVFLDNNLNLLIRTDIHFNTTETHGRSKLYY